MDSFLAYCSICCIMILGTDGVTLTFEMISNMPLKGSSLEFSCRMSENFNSGSLRIWKGTSLVTSCSISSCDYYKDGYSFTANITGAFGVTQRLTTDDEGTWRCQYISFVGAEVNSNTRNVTVYTIPSGLSITQNPDQDVDLSVNSIVIHCKTTNCTYPMPTIKWIFKDQATLPETVYATVSATVSQGLCTLSEMFYSSTLQIPQYTTFNDNSDKTGTFYCRIEYPDTSRNINSPLSKNIRFAVYVNSTTMSPSGSPLGSPIIFVEGQEKSVQCVTSPSRPRPQVRWWLGTEQVLDKITESESINGTLIVTTSVISLTLNRSHTHKVLYCDATVSGQQTWITSTESNVTVQYAPDVIVNISGSTIVGSTVVLMCSAQGEPPHYTFHPWIHRVGQTEIRRLNEVNTNITSILTLSNISIQDMGSYICTVDNSITGLSGQLNQTGDTSLYVQGRPVIDEIQTPFTGDPFKPSHIQIPFYSHTSLQKPTFFKQIGSLEIINTSDISSYIQPSNITMMFYNKNVTIPGYVAVLQFGNLTETDFGNYTLTLTNDQGSETKQFEFITSVPPSMPKKFFFVHIDELFLVFGLEKGFNGGHKQTFVVEYRPSGMSGAAWSTVYRINEDELPNPSSNGTCYIKIPKIQDGQYDFRVYAQNVKGNSSAIEGVYAEIKSESPPDLGFQVGAVAGGVVGGLLLVVVIIVLIFVLKRHKLNPKMKKYEREEEYTEQKHQDSAAPKGKPVKSSRGDIYENSPLPLKNQEEFVYENPGLVAADASESVYENPGPSASKGHLAEKDGLQYAVLKLGPPTTKGGKPVIHGLENHTEYAEIAFGKRGEPLPDSDEEKKDGAK